MCSNIYVIILHILNFAKKKKNVTQLNQSGENLRKRK